MASLISRLAGRQAGKQAESQADRQTYVQKDRVQKDKVQKDRCTNIHVHFCTDIPYIYRHRDTQTYRRADKQADRQTGTIHTVEADSRTASKQAVRHTGLQTERQTYRKNDS